VIAETPEADRSQEGQQPAGEVPAVWGAEPPVTMMQICDTKMNTDGQGQCKGGHLHPAGEAAVWAKRLKSVFIRVHPWFQLLSPK
jgi:hypothetical protein